MDCYNGEILPAEMRDNMKKEEVKTIDDKLNTMEFKVFGGH